MASATASTVAQAIATNPQASIPVQTSHNLTRSAKAADPEPLDGNRDQTEEFIRAVRIAVTMQADTFADERMKILYVLSFMHGGMAQVWAANETMAVITGTSQMQTLDIFLENVEKTFGDPDRAWTAHAQLHELKMTPGTTAEDYTARFEMLTGRTGFNDAALEDIYVRGLPNSILQKIFTQVTLPNSLAAWKTVVRNLDCLHRSLLARQTRVSDVKRSARPNHRPPPPPVSPHTSRLTHRHQIPPLLWTSTYRRHDQKLGSATTARKLDISRTTAQNPASSGPETTFRKWTSRILSPKP